MQEICYMSSLSLSEATDDESSRCLLSGMGLLSVLDCNVKSVYDCLRCVLQRLVNSRSREDTKCYS